MTNSCIYAEGTPTFYWYRKGVDFGNQYIRLVQQGSIGVILGSLLGFIVTRPIAIPGSDRVIISLAIVAVGVLAFCLFRSIFAGQKCLMVATAINHFSIDVKNKQVFATDGNHQNPIAFFQNSYSEIDLDQTECSIFLCGKPNIALIRALEEGFYARAHSYKDYCVRIKLRRNDFDAIAAGMTQ